MILRDRDANTAWGSQADGTLEERTYHCQNWRADVVALMTDAGRLVNQVRYDPYGVPFGIPKTDMDGDGDADTDDYTLYYSYYTGSTMPFADWNWDGTKNSTDLIAYGNDRTADSTLGRGTLGYGYSHASGAGRKGYAGYEIDPVLTGSEGWESVYHVRNRAYYSQLGKWTRRDPLGYVDGMSQYAYGPARVTTDVDSDGLALGSGMGSAGGGVVWPLPRWCKDNFGDTPVKCARCCETNANLEIKWCERTYPEGPERAECIQGVLTWHRLCTKACPKFPGEPRDRLPSPFQGLERVSDSNGSAAGWGTGFAGSIDWEEIWKVIKFIYPGTCALKNPGNTKGCGRCCADRYNAMHAYCDSLPNGSDEQVACDNFTDNWLQACVTACKPRMAPPDDGLFHPH